MADNVAEVR